MTTDEILDAIKRLSESYANCKSATVLDTIAALAREVRERALGGEPEA